MKNEKISFVMNEQEIKFIKRKFKKVSNFIPPGSKVLDIGCYDARSKDFFEDCDYYGVDKDKQLVHLLVKKGMNVKCADLNKDKLPFMKEKFDFVLLLDILEHVVDPSKLLNDSKNKLYKKGKLIVTLPNDYHLLNKIRFVFNKNLSKDPFVHYGHLHYFPIKSGEKFLLRNNLKILKRVNLELVTPNFLPQSIKNLLANFFPNNFSRGVLYLLATS